MFLVYWFSQQTDYCGYSHHYNEQDDAKVQIMNFSDDRTSGVNISTRWRWSIAKLPDESDQSDYKTYHQSPESTL